MKSPSFAAVLALALSQFAYAGSPAALPDASPPESLRSPEQTPQAAKDFDVLISRERIARGMSAEQLRRAWGDPDQAKEKRDADGPLEQWVYRRGSFQAQYIYLRDGVITSWKSPAIE